MSDQIVLRDSPDAAKPHTMSGWVSRNGLFFADEDAARYDGCTHVACSECGAPARKPWTKCPECIARADIARYWAMPEAEWDGKAMLFSHASEQYFNSLEDAQDHLEHWQTLDSLRLIICEPNHVRPLDYDYCGDDLPDDDDEVPDAVAEAMDAFNKAIKGVVLSWSPGKYRLKRVSA
jgi:hypothetical protein